MADQRVRSLCISVNFVCAFTGDFSIVESAFVRCAFKGTKQHMSVYQGDKFSVHLECCTSKGEVNISGMSSQVTTYVCIPSYIARYLDEYNMYVRTYVCPVHTYVCMYID